MGIEILIFSHYRDTKSQYVNVAFYFLELIYKMHVPKQLFPFIFSNVQKLYQKPFPESLYRITIIFNSYLFSVVCPSLYYCTYSFRFFGIKLACTFLKYVTCAVKSLCSYVTCVVTSLV